MGTICLRRIRLCELSSWCSLARFQTGQFANCSTAASAPRLPFAAGKRSIPKVDKVLLVAAGKGGVGKSTTAVNIALALASHCGLRVGLLDADISGPSIPHLMNVAGIKPQLTEMEPSQIIPLQNYGIHCMSMGSLVEQGKALAWRGPMTGKALEQLLFGVVWGRLDVLVVDTPPGTGDTHITLSQQAVVSGAVIVTTPQDIALDDVRRSVEMFQKMKIPIVGVLENMSHHVCSGCGKQSHIFGRGGAEKLAAEFNVPVLGHIPLEVAAMEGGESGTPIVVGDPASPLTAEYRTAAAAAWERLNSSN